MEETNWIEVTVQQEGRIAIPKPLRDYYKIKPGDKIKVKIKGASD